MYKMIKVTNRSNGFVSYLLPERNNLRREFNPSETKNIDENELIELAAKPGGKELIYNYLYISDINKLREILDIEQEEPEYWLTADKIPSWMTTSSLNEFKDGLEFSPAGIQDLIKKLAVDMPLNDVAKRDAIKEILHFDVTKALEINNASEEKEVTPATTTSKRRSKTSSIKIPEYKIVTPTKE